MLPLTWMIDTKLPNQINYKFVHFPASTSSAHLSLSPLRLTMDVKTSYKLDIYSKSNHTNLSHSNAI